LDKDLLESPITRSGDVTWRVIEGKCLLLHLGSGIYYTLDEVGRFIWESLDGKKPLGEILDEIVRKYDVDAGTARGDLLEMIRDLLEEDLACTGEEEIGAQES
jgi:hypothetical protein